VNQKDHQLQGTLSADPLPELRLDPTGDFHPQTSCMRLCVESKTIEKSRYVGKGLTDRHDLAVTHTNPYEPDQLLKLRT